MSDYEPPAEMVEALEREICGVYAMTASGSRWTALTRFVLRRQHERENTLRAAAADAVERVLETHSPYQFNEAVFRKYMDPFDAAHAKLDAPKVPTLLEAAKACVRGIVSHDTFAVAKDDLSALKAAVEREEKR